MNYNLVKLRDNIEVPSLDILISKPLIKEEVEFKFF